MIVDTSFIIDLMKSKDSAVEKLEELINREEDPKLSAVNSYELYRGAEKYHKTSLEERKIKRAIESLSGEKIPLEWNHGKKSAKIMGELEKDGDKIEMKDTVIASLAREKDEVILTGNPEHFERIDGVEVEGY